MGTCVGCSKPRRCARRRPHYDRLTMNDARVEKEDPDPNGAGAGIQRQWLAEGTTLGSISYDDDAAGVVGRPELSPGRRARTGEDSLDEREVDRADDRRAALREICERAVAQAEGGFRRALGLVAALGQDL